MNQSKGDVVMTTQVSTLTKLKSLESLYHQGYQSDIIDQTVDKIIIFERAHTHTELINLQADISNFEKKYQMNSEDFYTRFHAGKMGDQADFFEWSALYDMAKSLNKRLESLRFEA